MENNPTFNQIFAKRVIKARKRLKVPQTWVSKATGLANATIWKMETGKVGTSFENASRVAVVLGIDLGPISKLAARNIRPRQ